MKFHTFFLICLQIGSGMIFAIPKEFNLRENESATEITPEPPSKREELREDQFDEEEYIRDPRAIPPDSKLELPKVVPERPDAQMLHSTELQITPQRPRHLPERPRKPQGTPPPPLPMHQQERLSSSPY